MKTRNYFSIFARIGRLCLLAGALFVATTLSAADITTGLVAYYDFEGVNGTVVPDVSGSVLDGSLNGTLVGAPSLTMGKTGSGVNFPTVTDYMSMPTGILSTLTSFSISAWVNTAAVNTQARVCDFGTGTNAYMALSLKASTGFPRFAITTGSWNHEEDRYRCTEMHSSSADPGVR